MAFSLALFHFIFAISFCFICLQIIAVGLLIPR